MKNKLFFVDAETDGLYGSFLTVAIIITDTKFNEIERYYFGSKETITSISDAWTLQNVMPLIGSYEDCDTEYALLERVWEIWLKYSEDAYVIADVCVPVEARLFARCVEHDLETRKFSGPYPLLDLSSFLFAAGYDPLSERKELVSLGEMKRHNASDDVEITIEICRKLFSTGNHGKDGI